MKETRATIMAPVGRVAATIVAPVGRGMPADPVGVPEKFGGVSQEAARLNGNCEQLNGAISELARRLAAILEPCPPANAKDEAGPTPCSSQFALELRNRASEIADATSAINDIIRRLDL